MTHDIHTTQHDGPQQGEIILYQPDETVRLEVRLEDDTVWLNRQQLAELFGRDVKTIGKHVNNALKEELKDISVIAKFATTARDGKTYQVDYYNLDMVLSVGYRVKSSKGVQFRTWANKVIRSYLLRGYSINYQMRQLEQKLDSQQAEIKDIKQTLADHQEKIDFFVRTNQPPVEGVLFEGQIFDAYKLVEALVKSAQREIILIDNYIDATVFDLLEKRGQGVDATIYTEHVGQSLQHLQQLNQQQYGRRIELREYNSRFHDRFLILDDSLYHFGASFKDLGRRLFAFELMGIDKNVILGQL
jgi:hypothetical protein